MTNTQATPDPLLTVDCPKCHAQPGVRCKGIGTHLARANLYDGKVRATTTAAKPEYDSRYTTGCVLVVVGVILAALVLIGTIITADEDSGNEIDYSGAVGFIGLGGFVVLLGVILIAGAQRIDR